MQRFSILLVLCLVAVVVSVGCADPTRDKPRAVVEEAVPVPEPVPEPAGVVQKLVLGEGSSIGFVGSKVTGSHDGGFHSFEGEIQLVDGDPTKSSVELSIDATSLWADNEKLTGHLRSPDFFDVAAHPKAAFQSTEINPDGDHYQMVGNLTLHGVTKKISFPAHITIEGDRMTAEAEFSILRFDFGIEYKGKADDLIRDAVLIKLKLVGVPAESAG